MWRIGSRTGNYANCETWEYFNQIVSTLCKQFQNSETIVSRSDKNSKLMTNDYQERYMVINIHCNTEVYLPVIKLRAFIRHWKYCITANIIQMVK